LSRTHPRAPRAESTAIAALHRIPCPDAPRREEPAIFRSLERTSPLILALALIGLGFWLGSRDQRLDRAIEEQGKTLERTEQRLTTEETATAEHAAAIEEHRVAIAELRTQQAARDAEVAALGETSRDLQARLAKSEADLARQAELAAELAAVRDRLAEIERTGASEKKRLSTLEAALRELEAERASTADRLDRLERALGIEP
jgi:chromosome segregation ATPase